MNETLSQRVKNEAKKELNEENFKNYKTLYKEKLSQIETAKVVVQNLERELLELENDIENL